MISLPSQPAGKPRHDRELQRRTKANPAGFNPKGSHWRICIIFFCVWIQIRSTTHWIPAWSILRDFTWKTPKNINQKMIGNGPCFLKFFKGPLRNELSQLFVLPIQIASSKYRTWVQIRYILQGFDGLCLVHLIENPPKPSRTCSLLWITCI